MGDLSPIKALKSKEEKEIVNLFLGMGSKLVVEKRGKPTHLLMSIKDLASFLETWDILSNPDQRRMLDESLKAVKKGETFPLEKLLEE